VEIAKRRVAETREQRSNAVMIFWLGRGRRRRIGAAMKAPLEGDDLILAGLRVESGELDGPFVRLGPRVTEKGLPAKTAFAEQLGPPPLSFHIPRVGDMNQLGN